MAQRKRTGGGKKRSEGGKKVSGGGEVRLPMRFLVVSGRDHMQVSTSANGNLEDLSISGLVFQTPDIRKDALHLSYDESPLIRNRLILEIDLPGGHKFTSVGEVSWYERSFVAKDSLYHVGVTFTEISPKDREALRDYLVSREKMARSISLDS
jgi:hypothetical protein